MMIRILSVSAVLFFSSSMSIFANTVELKPAEVESKTVAKGLTYKKINKDKQVIHILEIDPKQYQLALVKAHNQVFGRETVESMALRKGAVAAINGGFFEIGQGDDGRPSGTLIINDQIFSWARGTRASLMFDDQKTNISPVKVDIHLLNSINHQQITPHKINQFTKSNLHEVVLYTSSFGFNSLTPHNRKEILVNKNGYITDIVEHGDNPIQEGGFIVSLPKSYPHSVGKVGDKLEIKTSLNNTPQNTEKNILTGIPMIVRNHVPIVEIGKLGTNAFAALPHARTAFGVKKNGTIVWAVVEHAYTKSLNQVTLAETHETLKKKGYSAQKIQEANLKEILPVIKDHYSDKSRVGLSLPDLARLMAALGCEQAINLDGGGSSSLFLDGKIINNTFGDIDESLGQIILRPVSDAIVALKRK